MNVLREVQDCSGTGEADRMDALSEVVQGETDRMDVLLEIGTKSFEAGIDSARQTPMEDVPAEASLLQFGDAVGGTPVVAQMQISRYNRELKHFGAFPRYRADLCWQR